MTFRSVSTENYIQFVPGTIGIALSSKGSHRSFATDPKHGSVPWYLIEIQIFPFSQRSAGFLCHKGHPRQPTHGSSANHREEVASRHTSIDVTIGPHRKRPTQTNSPALELASYCESFILNSLVVSTTVVVLCSNNQELWGSSWIRKDFRISGEIDPFGRMKEGQTSRRFYSETDGRTEHD